MATPPSSAPDRARGSFVAPTLIELAHPGQLDREVFGPVLHVVRWRRDALDALLDAVGASGHALTLGVHTRIDETVDLVTRRSRAGNQYVNRNMIGAVVGVQPFGGEGLSGTGPKAGGPLYLRRLLVDPPPVPVDVLAAAAADGAPAAPAPAGAWASSPPAGAAVPAVPSAGSHAPAAPASATGQACAPVAGYPRASAPAQRADDAGAHGQRTGRDGALHPLHALRGWLAGSRGDPADAALAPVCDALAEASPVWRCAVLPGVTGERNTWTLRPRRAVLCLAVDRGDLLVQLAHVLAAGSLALWPHDAVSRRLADELPRGVRPRVELLPQADLDVAACDLALIQADAQGVAAWSRRLARRAGPIVGLIAAPPGARHAGVFPLERLVVERTLTVNTAAAGGNASLTTVG